MQQKLGLEFFSFKTRLYVRFIMKWSVEGIIVSDPINSNLETKFLTMEGKKMKLIF